MSKSALKSFIHGCIDLGYRHFDHADIYGGYTTEAAFGEVLKSDATLKNSAEITTKCGINYVCDQRDYKVKGYDSSKEHIVRSVERSLQNLGMEQIHTLLIHRPDYLLDIEEMVDAFAMLKTSGKVAHVGLSNFNLETTKMVHEAYPIDMIQVEIHPLSIDAYQSGLLAYCTKEGISVSSWSPLAGGRFLNDSDQQISSDYPEVANTLCEKYNVERDQLLFAWLRTHKAGIVPLSGTSKLERIKGLKHTEDIHLEREDFYLLLESIRGIKVP